MMAAALGRRLGKEFILVTGEKKTEISSIGASYATDTILVHLGL